MKVNITVNKYYIQNMNTDSFRNTKQNFENKKVSYKEIQAKEEKKLNNANNNTMDNGDEIRDGIIISASLRKQIEARHSQKDIQNNSQMSSFVYTYNGVYTNKL